MVFVADARYSTSDAAETPKNSTVSLYFSLLYCSHAVLLASASILADEVSRVKSGDPNVIHKSSLSSTRSSTSTASLGSSPTKLSTVGSLVLGEGKRSLFAGGRRGSALLGISTVHGTSAA